MSFLDSIAKIAKSVVKSPVTKVVAGGVSLVMPAVGVPALAALAAADKVVSAADKGVAAMKQVKAAGAVKAPVPGGRTALGSVLAQSAHSKTRLVQGAAAARIVTATQQQAAKGDPEAKRALAALKLVQAAKQGKPAARKALALEVRKQVNGIVAAGKRPGASDSEKQAARLTVALVKATAARQRTSRRFGVDRRTARVVRVA